MGWVLSKFRKSKSTMEVLTKLDADIKSIVEFKASTAQTQKKVVGHLVTYSIVIYLLVAIFTYFKLFPAAKTTKDQLFLLLPFLVSPLLIWGLRRLLTWWYHRKIIKNEKKLELLKQRKLKILDEVMEKETYKVAKEILDKFGDKSHLSGPGPRPLPGMSAVFKPGGAGAAGDSQLRRRTVGEAGSARPGLNTSLPVPSAGPASGAAAAASKGGPGKLNTSLAVTSSSRPAPGPGGRPGPGGPAGGPPPAQPPGRQMPPLPAGGGRAVPGPPLPRPILPRERGYLDKFVEFLVGDGPANRYALICRQCESHNGMALREEFEYIAFRCCYCYYWNPARKQRPVAPRLTAAAERPVAASNTSESSGSDVSAPNSVPGSRRSSVSKPMLAPAAQSEDVKVSQEAEAEKIRAGSEVEEVASIIDDIKVQQDDNNQENNSAGESNIEPNVSDSETGSKVKNIESETDFEHIESHEAADSDQESSDIVNEINLKSTDRNENEMDVDS